MEHGFWHQKWENNQIGFHLSEVNQLLVKYFPQDKFNDKPNVLVPLCGKSNDLLWLADNAKNVVGCELSPVACQQFFVENQLEHQITKEDNFQIFSAKNMTLFCGDFFAFSKQHCGEIDLIYDRAALVALPPIMRQEYAKHISKLVESNKWYLLITLSYNDKKRNAPPFSVTPNEVEQLFANNFTIQHCEDVLEHGMRGEIVNHVFLLQRK